MSKKLVVNNNYAVAEIQNALLNGIDVEIEGIGTLSPMYRKVRNSYGRDYTITIKVIQNKKMKDLLLKSYKKNPENFIKQRV